MAERKPFSQQTPAIVALRGLGIALLAIVFGITAILLLLLLERGILARCTRYLAARQLHNGAVSAAQQWLAWSAWLDPDHGETDVLRAVCFRHLSRQDEWEQAIQSAERKRTSAVRVQQELTLALIQAGEMPGEVDQQLFDSIEATAPEHDVATAFVRGHLMRREPELARMILDAWAAKNPEDAHLAYASGVYWLAMADSPEDAAQKQACFRRAQAEFERAIARQPRHELARLALAEHFEQQNRFREAFEQYIACAIQCPASEPARVGVARLLRKSGRLDEARSLLEPLAAAEPSSDVLAELGQIELESGQYPQAEDWFQRGGVTSVRHSEPRTAAAIAFAVQGRFDRAERLFHDIDADHRRSVRINDLQARLRAGGDDPPTVAELQRLAPLSPTAPLAGHLPSMDHVEAEPQTPQSGLGPRLYALHCAACHGASGDGKGRAAPHLYPKPRNLRAGRFRLVTTLNGVPTLADVAAVISRGMPGTSMRSFDNLSQQDIDLLALEVQGLRREGLRDRMIGQLTDAGEEVDADYVEETVEYLSTPGEVIRVPPIGTADSRTIARGRDLFSSLGCHNCHGVDGVGTWDLALFDDDGYPVRARDLVHEVFRGGQEPHSIYLRIVAGMPGSPHPSCPSITEEQRVELVHYCRDLSQEPKRVLTNHQRALLVHGRDYLLAVGRSPPP